MMKISSFEAYERLVFGMSAEEELVKRLETKNGVCAMWIRMVSITRAIVDVKTGFAIVEWDIDGRQRLADFSALGVCKDESIQIVADALRNSLGSTHHSEPDDIINRFCDAPHPISDMRLLRVTGKDGTTVRVITPSRLCASIIWTSEADVRVYEYYAGAAEAGYTTSKRDRAGCADAAGAFLMTVQAAMDQILVPVSTMTQIFRSRAKCVNCNAVKEHINFAYRWFDDNASIYAGLCGDCCRDAALYTLALATHGSEFVDDQQPARKRARAAVRKK
jgi:hypothetical protein